MKKRIAINGFGRIGRLAFRGLLSNENVEIVAINDLTDVKTLSLLLKRDSVHGSLAADVSFNDHALVVDGREVQVSADKDPSSLPWKNLNIDLVLECTGVFRDEKGAGKHLEAGAKRVLISAPASGNIPTVVLGVNEDILDKNPRIVSNASCTTNCLAPLVKVLDAQFGLTKGFITTIHAYTADQRLQDAPHKDLRRARAAALNMVPTTTGAAVAVGLVLPHLAGRLDGLAIRVPVPDGSITDLVAILDKEVSAEEVNDALLKASKNEMTGIVEYSNDPIVSSDIIGNTHSCVFDSGLTRASGNLVKVYAWYDNEIGYASRLIQVAERMCLMG